MKEQSSYSKMDRSPTGSIIDQILTKIRAAIVNGIVISVGPSWYDTRLVIATRVANDEEIWQMVKNLPCMKLRALLTLVSEISVHNLFTDQSDEHIQQYLLSKEEQLIPCYQHLQNLAKAKVESLS